MSQNYQYFPADEPIVAGHAARFQQYERDFGRSTSIATTRRMLTREPYEPTGDQAFDVRVNAVRDALLTGTKEAYKETHDGFNSVGLY
jgi:hypothetical protein